MERYGKIIFLDHSAWQGIIEDTNGEEISFDLSEWIEGLELGVTVSFDIQLSWEGLVAIKLRRK